MIQNNKNLINDLILKKIFILTFIERYKFTGGKFSYFIIKNMEKALIYKDFNLIALLLIAAESDGLNSHYTSIFCRLLKDVSIPCIEDIVMALDEIRDPSAIEGLYELALLDMAQEENSALAKKCIYALKSIDTKESIQKIKFILAETNSEIIKDCARLNLQNIK